MSKRVRQTTTTCLVEEALRGYDDFLSIAMLSLYTRRSYNQISAALFHLREHRVVDVVVNPDGTGWWYALPQEDDNRLYTIPETAVGVTKPKRRKRPKPEPI